MQTVIELQQYYNLYSILTQGRRKQIESVGGKFWREAPLS